MLTHDARRKTDDDGRQPIAIGHLSYMYPGSLLQGMIQTNSVYSNNDQGSVYQNCKFYDPRGRGSCLRCGHVNHIVKLLYYTPVNEVQGGI